MKLTFLGTRGYIPHRSRLHRRHTVTLLSHGRSRVLLDWGEDWRGRLGAISPHAILVTHAHPDHVLGLDRGANCGVYATSESWEAMRSFPIASEHRHVLEPRRLVRIGDIGFEPFPVVHSTRAPAVGYRISTGNRPIFYVPDVAAIPDRHSAFADIRAYVGDGATVVRSMVRRERRTGRPIGHASIREQLDWCRAEGVREMIVTHCGSQIVAGDERKVGARVRALGRERGVRVQIARDGLEISLR